MTHPIALLVALCLGTSSVTSEPAAAVTATEEDDTRGRALAAFADGERAWAKEDYASAAEHFAEAQRLIPHPFTQYNLGLAQHRAGAHEDAWHTFESLIDAAPTEAQRSDAIRAQARVRAELAFVQVNAPPQARVCFDGRPLHPSDREMTSPGEHALTIDGRRLPLKLERGETRVIDATSSGPANDRRRRAQIAWGIVAAGSAAAATGLAVGGGLADDRGLRRGLTFGAAAASALAVGAVVGLWVTRRRSPPKRHRGAKASERADCASADVAATRVTPRLRF